VWLIDLGDDADLEALPGREMYGNVATVIDIGPPQASITESTSSATAPATADMGVMKTPLCRWQAATMRRATEPETCSGALLTQRRSIGNSATSSSSIVRKRPTACA
jgi:hypothetical protein